MKKTNWNENWYYWEMYNSFTLMWDVPKDAVKVKLPHDAMLHHRAYAQSQLGGNSGYRDGGHFCYSKILEIENKLLSRYILHFDGVYENAAVYANGNLILRHPYGYTPFLADITEYLEPGRNEIRVMTNNRAVSSRWYPGGGIYRDVHLFTAEQPVYILPDGIRVRTPQIAPDLSSAGAEISVTVRNDTSCAKEVKLEVRVSPSGQICSGLATLEGFSEKTVTLSLDIKDPVLWSGNVPSLYMCETTLFCKEQDAFIPADSGKTRFGIRQLHMDPQNGFQVNGKTVRLRGACIHPDNGLIGAVEMRDAVYRKIRILKEAGFNAVRISHHPASSVLLDVCDELGMLVMNECFDVWTRNKTDYDYANYFEDWWERDVEAMVISSCNHPSVIMYSLGNEIPEIGIRRGQEICRMLHDKVKQLDSTRYTTVAVNGVFSVGDIIPEIVEDVLGPECVKNAGGNVNEFLTIMDQNVDRIVVHDRISERVANASEIVDVCGYNYMIARYEKDVEEYPDRMIVGSETYPPEIGRIWSLVEKHPQIIGDFTWTGWDYIGEAGLGIPAFAPGEGGFGARFPSQLAYIGDMDITGFRRPASYYREMVFGLRKSPYIVVNDPAHYENPPFFTPWVLTAGVPKWDYPGMEGKPVLIEVYSPGDEAELFLNGRSLGRKQTDLQNDGKTTYQITYEPGILRAAAYHQGTLIGEYSLKTSQGHGRLCACLEENGSELVYVGISCVDRQGMICQNYDKKIRVLVKGALESRLGTGNPKPESNYTDMETYLWYGRAQLVIRKERAQDEVEVIITGEDEEPVVLHL